MARREKKGPTFTPDVVGHVLERMLEEEDQRYKPRNAAAKPVTLSTGRWLRCPDCGGKGGDCPRCHGGGEIVQARSS